MCKAWVRVAMMHCCSFYGGLMICMHRNHGGNMDLAFKYDQIWIRKHAKQKWTRKGAAQSNLTPHVVMHQCQRPCGPVKVDRALMSHFCQTCPIPDSNSPFCSHHFRVPPIPTPSHALSNITLGDGRPCSVTTQQQLDHTLQCHVLWLPESVLHWWNAHSASAMSH